MPLLLIRHMGFSKRATGRDGKMFGKETIYSTDDKAAQWDFRPDDDLLHSLVQQKSMSLGRELLCGYSGASPWF